MIIISMFQIKHRLIEDLSRERSITKPFIVAIYFVIDLNRNYLIHLSHRSFSPE